MGRCKMMKLLNREDLLKMKTSKEIVKTLAEQPWLGNTEIYLHKRELSMKEREEQFGEGNPLISLINKKVKKF